MKKKITRYGLFGTILVFLVVLGCKQDDFYNYGNSNSFNENGLKIRILKGQEAQSKANRFKNDDVFRGGFVVQSQKGMNFRTASQGTIRYDEILEVIDTLGNTNYTFLIEGHPEQDEKSIFNLVVNVKDGEQKTYLLKHEMEESFAESYHSGYASLEFFTGDITLETLATSNPCGETFSITGGGNDGGNGSGDGGDPGNGFGNSPGSGSGSGFGGGGNGVGNEQEVPGGLESSPCDPVVMMNCLTNYGGAIWSESDCSCIISPRYLSVGSNIVVTNVGIRKGNPCGEEQLIGSVGVIENQPNPKNCEELKKLTVPKIPQDSVRVNKIKELEDYIGQTKEYGIAFRRHPNGLWLPIETVQSDYANPDNIDLTNYVGGWYIGAAHTHPDPSTGAIPMFSAGDIKFLFDVSSRHNTGGQPKDYSVYFLTLTVASGTYAIKIGDVAKFIFFRNTKYGEFQTDLQLAYNLTNLASPSELQKDLLKTLQKHNAGVELYKASDDLSEWSELVLDPNNPNAVPILKPCN